jgi:hypothetical protein
MGGNRNDRDTRNLDREELQRLARESVEADDGKKVAGEPDVAESRTATLQDPLTMALLAEVARNARTQDFDPAELPVEKPAEPVAHPNLKRR